MLLIKRDPNIGPFDPLDIVNELPPLWDGPHVGLRLVEGFETLRSMPLGDHTGDARTAWPGYMYEFDDLVEQQKQGELERTLAAQNRTRVSPSVREITRAIEVCYWPTKFLSHGHLQLCEAVNAVAFAHALGFDAGWVTRKRGGYADTWRVRHDHGCELIAERLIANRVTVF
jgi:hypothetical protein